MKKDEIFELVVKGFGVYLLVLAVMAIPKMFEGVVMLVCWLTRWSSWPLGEGISIDYLRFTIDDWVEIASLRSQ